MKTKLALVMMLIALALVLTAAWAAQHFVKQRSAAGHEALRKAAEFLQPDMHSDLRFGHHKPASQTP